MGKKPFSFTVDYVAGSLVVQSPTLPFLFFCQQDFAISPVVLSTILLELDYF